MPPVARRECLKVTPRFPIRFQRFRDVSRKLWNCGPRRVLVFRWRGRQTGLREQACRPQLLPPLPIDSGPPAARFARREFAGVSILVQPLDQAVDPPEAERLVQGIEIANGAFRRMTLMKYEPNLDLRAVMLLEPLPPLPAGSHIKRVEVLRRNLEVPVELPAVSLVADVGKRIFSNRVADAAHRAIAENDVEYG